jgi:DNA-binding MarR family transcriptional regulator
VVIKQPNHGSPGGDYAAGATGNTLTLTLDPIGSGPVAIPASGSGDTPETAAPAIGQGELGEPAATDAGDAEVKLIEEALSRIIRRARQRPAHEQLMAAAGVSIERAAFTVAKLCEAGPVRLSDLATTLDVNVSTISRHVQQLERDGLLRRTEDPRDRRAAMLHLTDQGRAVLERVWAARRAALVLLFEQWSPEDRRRFSELLARFADEIGEAFEATIRDRRRRDRHTDA